jgi:hypothetical protein
MLCDGRQEEHSEKDAVIEKPMPHSNNVFNHRIISEVLTFVFHVTMM